MVSPLLEIPCSLLICVINYLSRRTIRFMQFQTNIAYNLVQEMRSSGISFENPKE
jgi:hypothetical protein